MEQLLFLVMLQILLTLLCVKALERPTCNRLMKILTKPIVILYPSWLVFFFFIRLEADATNEELLAWAVWLLWFHRSLWMEPREVCVVICFWAVWKTTTTTWDATLKALAVLFLFCHGGLRLASMLWRLELLTVQQHQSNS
jgi:hypothetical protein